jgi:transcriptional regulator with XRE-family HTH domain
MESEADFAREIWRETRRRIAAGELTGARLARKAGLSQPAVANWLAGKRRLSMRSLEMVLLVLHGQVSIEWGRDVVVNSPTLVAALFPHMSYLEVGLHLARARSELVTVNETIQLLEGLAAICRQREQAAAASDRASEAAELPEGERRQRKRPAKRAAAAGATQPAA